MLDLSTIEKYDSQKMYKVYDKWPEIARESFESNQEPVDFHDIDFKEIHSVSGNILTKVMSLIYMLDYASIYRAILLKTDPSPVSSIDYIKSRI